MVFHFGCELHEQCSFSHMLANGCKEGRDEDEVKGQNAENNLQGEENKKKREGEKDRQTERERD